MKEINFILSIPEYSGWVDKPYPAIKNFPIWYKEMDLYHSNPGSEYEKSQSMTIKRCIPVRDILSTGYFIPLPCDVEVFYNTNDLTYDYKWRVDDISILEAHDPNQTYKMDIPLEFDVSAPMKWNSPWIINTPKGYSCIFITPQLRDLPFYSVPAVVDTDIFNLPINFPFFIKNNFSGIIPKGTPLIQVIPFKREEWESNTDKEDFNNKSKLAFLRSKFMQQYKKNIWQRKIFS